MTDRYTRGWLSVIAVASTLLLTSCSNPDTSGGVTLSKGADDANEFPHGSCEGPGKNPHTYDQGCGWISVYEGSYYIMPGAKLAYSNLSNADLSNANLCNADLWKADLTGAKFSGVTANSSTVCPNDIKWGTAGNDCPF